MLSKLLSFIQKYRMLQPGDHVVCAVSGGADSVALLFALYLLRGKLGITLSAAHFNHRLRGEESDADEAFVRKLCQQFEIDLSVSSGEIVAGKKGLEAAARDARYAFLKSLPGKIATAHTADDNAETVLMHLVRGTGLKGLGAISPVNGSLIRPMLSITRQEVEAFLEEYHLQYVTDSSNDSDAFLRNRIRHNVMPLLRKENPSIAENLSAMALRLREDEQVLAGLTLNTDNVMVLQEMPDATRRRSLAGFLQRQGVSEPDAEHIAMAERLVFSDKPSARASFPGGVTIGRNYDRLIAIDSADALEELKLSCPGEAVLPSIGVRVTCEPAGELLDSSDSFSVSVQGNIILRARKPGDVIRLKGGSKSLKKLFVDKKLPAHSRMLIPVIADDGGVLGVYGFGAHRDRLATELPAVLIRFIPM